MEQQEIWKDIEGYDGKYQVSNMGRLRSNQFGSWRIMHPSTRKPLGYKRVHLSFNGKIKGHQVHRLVAKAFVEGYADGLVVNHKNENPSDNRAENLEWVTYGYNSNYGTTRIRVTAKESRYIVVQLDQDGKEMAKFYGFGDASRSTGISDNCIWNCCKGKQSTAGGYKWKCYPKDPNDVLPDVHRASPLKEPAFKSLNGETWKTVEGYEGLYEVSDMGRVRSYQKTYTHILKPRIIRKWPHVLLNKDGVQNKVPVARLVAMAFVDGYKSWKVPYCKNGNKEDNRACNSEWVTRSRLCELEGASRSIPVLQFSADGMLVAKHSSIIAASASCNTTCKKLIRECCNGKRDTAYGYRWKYNRPPQQLSLF